MPGDGYHPCDFFLQTGATTDERSVLSCFHGGHGPAAGFPGRCGLWAKDGQLILPLLDLVEQAQCAIDDLVDVMGRATIEAVLSMSAQQLAGPKQQGKKTDRDVVYHGTQRGRVALKERQLGVTKPRLRKKQREAGGSGEVEIPAYTALQKDGRPADRMLDIMMAGVSTRRYAEVLPQMAEQCGRHRRTVLPSCVRGQIHRTKVVALEETSRAGPRARFHASSLKRASGC